MPQLRTFECSETMLERALELIPLASQTFSKSITALPRGVSPYFVDRAHGCRFWDLDGNNYVDLAGALASVTLGYCHPKIDEAVRKQLENGVTFSLPHSLEAKVASQIVEMVPCAEMVRFAKNGTDATSGAIRLARHVTGRDHVALCGYHGWQDWSIGTTSKDAGIPDATKNLSHIFPYNDIAALEKLLNLYKDKFAAVILEPMNATWPQDGFLDSVKSLTHKHKALLIFDETITGFRFSNGGAQELFNVTPDLATFGKGLANGHPLSALVGRANLMDRVDEIFFSGTFGGETLSLAAAQAVLTELIQNPVIEQIAQSGLWLAESVFNEIEENELASVFELVGHPSWKIWIIHDHPNATKWEIRTFLLQELFQRGIFVIGSHNISAAHTHADLQEVVVAYREVLSLLKVALSASDGLKTLLRCEPLKPLFKVR